MNLEQRLDEVRSTLNTMSDHIKRAVIHYSRLKRRLCTKQLTMRQQKKLENLAFEQEKPLNKVTNTIKILGDLKIPDKIKEYLALSSKHPVRDKFDEMHFLADVDGLLRTMKTQGAENAKLDEVNAMAHWYCKQMKKQKEDPMLGRIKRHLTENGIEAVLYDKGLGFCLIKEATYIAKLEKILRDMQFVKLEHTGSKNPFLTFEEKWNKELRALWENNKIDEELLKKLRSTGVQPATLYGLAKVYKNEIPLRPLLSLPGSMYDPLNKRLAKLFHKMPGANIETSTKEMSERLRATTLEPDETIFSMDVKSLYANVPVHEAIDLAIETLYMSQEPEIERDTLRRLMEKVVTEVWFMAGTQWYIQRDGVDMGRPWRSS